MVSYVLAQTGAKTLTYIGHSQGTIQAFSGLTLNPVTASQINLFVALAPVAYVNNQRSVLLSIMADLDVVAFFEIFGKGGGGRGLRGLAGTNSVLQAGYSTHVDFVPFMPPLYAPLCLVTGDKSFLPDASVLQLLAPGLCSLLPNGCDIFLELLCGPVRTRPNAPCPVQANKRMHVCSTHRTAVSHPSLSPMEGPT
jgi:hypothetical protein